MTRLAIWFVCAAVALAVPVALVAVAPFAVADDDDGDDRNDDDNRDDDDDDDGRGNDDDGPGGDDDDDDRDPEYGPYVGPDGTRALAEDEILDRDGALARRAQIAALNADDAALRRARRLGFTILETMPLDGLDSSVTILAAPPGLTVRDSLSRLRRGDRRTIYDYNHFYSYRPTAVAASRRTLAEAPRRTPLSDRDDIVVGLIDVHVDDRHEALAGATIQTASFSEAPRIAEADHGTSVAGLIVGQGGLTPRARLYAAGVFSTSRNGDAVSAALELVRALDWMVANRVPVINMSLAGPDNAILEAAIERAIDRGHIVVAAVGNDGPGAPPRYPAAYDGVVGVTAVDGDNKIYRRAARGKHVDLSAPGVDVVSAASDGYGKRTGTSFAAPHVSAALAASVTVLDKNETARAIDDLIARAEDLGAAGRDDVYGHGLSPLD